MTVIDASVWVSIFLPAYAHHGASAAWWDTCPQNGLPVTVPELVNLEVAGAVARRTGDPALGVLSAQRIKAVPGVRMFGLDIADATIQIAAECFLRGADAVYVALALELGEDLATFDAEMIARAPTEVTVIVPS